jgi:putative IMPACT (imprinted ancient) family translation regulator
LVRAYTDSVAQALLGAQKVAIIRQQTLRCTAPYAMEGLVRREVELAQARLLDVAHGNDVRFTFSLPQDAAPALMSRLTEAGHGRIAWLGDEDE